MIYYKLFYILHFSLSILYCAILYSTLLYYTILYYIIYYTTTASVERELS